MSEAGRGDRYKWTVLINTTIGTLMATIDSSIVLISLPAIFRGIDMNPLTTSNTSYLLWMLMSYMVVTAVGYAPGLPPGQVRSVWPGSGATRLGGRRANRSPPAVRRAPGLRGRHRGGAHARRQRAHRPLRRRGDYLRRYPPAT